MPGENRPRASKAELVATLNDLRSRHDTTIVVPTPEVNLVPQSVDAIYAVARGSAPALHGPRGKSSGTQRT